jgi:hypothetical protein
MSSDQAVKTVAGRSCEGCALCCMVLGIQEIDKPKNTWCGHCVSRKSCGIYESRPTECRTFYCGYLTVADLGEEWKPSRSKIVMVADRKGTGVTAHVDPQRPDAWKKEPFYSRLKLWSRAASRRGGEVLVCVGPRTYRILPDRDIDAG